MIGGMDMNQMLAGIGTGSGQFGLEGYNSPSGMNNSPFGAPGGGGWQQALSSFGKSLGGMQGNQGGEAQAMQQQDHGGFQRLLEQLMSEQRPQSQSFGGRYANYLTHNL